MLREGALHARPIIVSLLIGRVTITPMKNAVRRWVMRGEGTLRGLFMKAVFPVGMASPTGFALVGLTTKLPKTRWMLAFAA